VVLSGQGAAVVAVHVGSNFTNLDSNGIAGFANGPGNHAVIVQDVELVNGRLLFDMPNSWDVNFGDEGHAYLTWVGHMAQTVRYHGFFFVAVGSNPGGVPVP